MIIAAVPSADARQTVDQGALATRHRNESLGVNTRGRSRDNLQSTNNTLTSGGLKHKVGWLRYRVHVIGASDLEVRYHTSIDFELLTTRRRYVTKRILAESRLFAGTVLAGRHRH